MLLAGRLGGIASRQVGLLRSQSALSRLSCAGGAASLRAPASSSAYDTSFRDKNVALGRPMSPHLTIYKPQLTSMLSITHRLTGAGLSVAVSALAMGYVAAGVPAAEFAATFNAHAGGLALPIKACIMWPLAYHTLNGMRHLAWDSGKGFDLPTLYKSGWFVFGLSFVLGAALTLK